MTPYRLPSDPQETCPWHPKGCPRRSWVARFWTHIKRLDLLRRGVAQKEIEASLERKLRKIAKYRGSASQ